MKWFPDYNYILASKSPRRQDLLKSIGIDFQIKVKEVDEVFPSHLFREEIPIYLSVLKSQPFLAELNENDLLITADTIVWLDNELLGKPKNLNDAGIMLRKLSDKEHQVITAVCLSSDKKQRSFFSESKVTFKELSDSEIEYYVQNYKPLDKAGAYGIQEWIGYIGITHIEGSFFNVMGLPIQQLYVEIKAF